MKLVIPTTVTDSNYAAYPNPNGDGYVNDGDYLEWNIATAYIIGDRIIVDALHSQFECIVAHTGTAPTLEMVTPWIRIGASNAWKPFDGVINNQAVSTPLPPPDNFQSIRLDLYAMGAFDTICVMNVSGSDVTVQVNDQFGTLTYSGNKSTIDFSPIIDAWTYCFAACQVTRNVVFDGIDGWGLTSDSQVLIIISSGYGVASYVGEVVVGKSYTLGKCKTEPTKRLVDYSRKEATAYGDFKIVERVYSTQASFNIKIETGMRGLVEDIITANRARPAVYFPTADDAGEGLVIYGFPSDFEIIYVTTEYCEASLQIEGLS